MGWWPRRVVGSGVSGCCRRGWLCTTCWRWRCSRTASYEEVMRQLVEGLAWESGWQRSWEVPSKVAIYKARQRLGREPLELLFRAVAVPLASEATRGAFYRGWRLVSLDGTCLDVADTTANTEAFGRPGSSRREGGGAFPQVRLVGLAETGTHAIFDAALGPYASSEQELAERLIGRARRTGCCASPTVASTASSGSSGPCDRGAAALAGQGRPRAAARAAAPGRLLPDQRLRAERPQSQARRRAGARRRVPARRSRPGRRGAALPAADHDPRPRPGARGRARRALPAALGARVSPRRAQDPPARPTRRAALEDTRRRLPGGLRLPLHPLRDPPPHARRRAPRRPRPPPLIVHPQPPRRPPQHPNPAGIFPPSRHDRAPARRSPRSSPNRSPNADHATTPGSSNAR